MSIVLVVIGLIVGGILVGRDLIKAAEARAQISQIEKYQTAVNTFHDKFAGIPGDLSLALAAQFGLIAGTGCYGTQGQRDGNGVIDGAQSPYIGSQGIGETALFWQDLSTAKFIPYTIPANGYAAFGCNGCAVVVNADIPKVFPAAAITGNYVSVYENNGINWFSVRGIYKIATCGNINFTSTGGINVIQAYNIDNKIDDGVPTTGTVQATGMGQVSLSYAYNTSASDPLQCYYSNPVNAPPGGVYSISAATGGNNSNSPNCILSFRFQ